MGIDAYEHQGSCRLVYFGFETFLRIARAISLNDKHLENQTATHGRSDFTPTQAIIHTTKTRQDATHSAFLHNTHSGGKRPSSTTMRNAEDKLQHRKTCSHQLRRDQLTKKHGTSPQTQITCHTRNHTSCHPQRLFSDLTKALTKLALPCHNVLRSTARTPCKDHNGRHARFSHKSELQEGAQQHLDVFQSPSLYPMSM